MDRTLVDLLDRRAAEQGGSTAFTRWADELHHERHLSYAALDRRARAIGAALQADGLAGERVLLLVPPGLDYVAAFFGCLYGGAVAVPYYPPSGALADAEPPASARRSRGVTKLQNLAAAATPAAVITQAGQETRLGAALGNPELRTFSVDQLQHTGESLPWQRPAIDRDSLAFLQFTSGSTGAPRGVMLTHGHLLTNSEFIRSAFGQSDASTVVSWLPPYHDMGLIGGVLQPVFSGGRCVLLTPVEFLQRPRRWLEAIDRHRADTSGGPNSAYDLCVRRIPADQRQGLNLASWNIAFTGAEPIRPDTLKRFVEAFAANGMRPEALFPCYGLAEGTLAVTASRPQSGARVTLFDREALQQQRAIPPGDAGLAKALVSSGTAVGSLRVLAVDAACSVELPRYRIGEIWVQGGSVAGGYWQDPVATHETFGARLASGDGPFLRTGDLGFVDAEGHVFIAGRSRDLIILRGRNYHPADIEATVESSHLVIRSSGCAAFSMVDEDEELLVVVAELDPRSGPGRDGHHDLAALNAIAAVIRAAVLADHDVEPAVVQLVVAGSVPRTTSGKIERYASRERYLHRSMPVLHEWRRTSTALAAVPIVKRPPATAAERDVALVWAAVLATDDPGLDDDFFEVGGHSLMALELVEQLQRRLGVEVPLKALIEHSTLERLAQYVAQLPRAGTGGRAASAAVAAQYEPFPLTDVQEAYLFGRSTAFELGGVATQGVAEFEAIDVDNRRLLQAIDHLVQRHDMLRAVIDADGRQSVQREVASFPLVTIDLANRSADQRTGELDAIRASLSESMKPVDRWPLFDIVSVRLDHHRFRVFARFDLLIADLHSLRLLWRELGILYSDPRQLTAGPSLSFRDAVVGERETATGPEWDRSVAFWRERLATLPPAPELPYVNTFRAVGAPRFRRRVTVLSAGDWTRIQQRARRAHVTPSTVLLAAFADVLATWSRHPAFTLTLTFFNRPRIQHIDEVVGDFTSLLLVSVDASAPDFATFVRAVQESVWESLAHRQAGGVRALRELARLQGRTAQAILPVVFTSAIGQEEANRPSPWAWLGELVGGVSSTPQVVLDHQVQEDGDRLLLSWDSVDALFPEGVLDDMFAAYRQRLEWLAAADVEWTAPAPSLVPAQQLARFAEANRTAEPLAPATLHGLFLERVNATPDHTAVIAADGTMLTYADVDRRSRAVADWLIQRGVNQDELVAIVMRKGWEQVVAALAVTRAGGAYLPIDPSLPDERRHHLMGRGRTRLVLTQAVLDRDQAWPQQVSRLAVDDFTASGVFTQHDSADSQEPVEDWTARAYVIFTSGSTGQPKGVTIDHRGAVNTIVDLNRRFSIGAGDRVFGISGLGFDLSVYDIFGTLAAGATLVLPAPGSERNPEHWLDLVTKHGVTLWNSVPALFEMLCDYAAGSGASLPKTLRRAWLSGDWVPVTLPDRARALRPGLEVISMGGATEASIWSVIHPIGTVDPGSRSIPYGRPMVNQQMHVLDHQWRPRPEWVGGDLYIGGVGVALGYWRDEEKTDRSFVHPSAALGRIYRTGDLARWRPDGNLEFLGRDDGQVKIGGLRIELGEVEAALNAHPSVRQAVVVPRHLDGVATTDASAASRRQLVAFVVPAQGSIAADELASWLASKIPSGMIPRRFVPIESLPLSSNGKVDTAKLVVPAQIVAARAWKWSADEAAVRDIWADAIGIRAEMIGPTDNFFDLGGSSITLVRVANALSAHAGRNVPLLSLFSQPTVPDMARLLTDSDSARTASVKDRASRRQQRMASMRSAKTPRPSLDERH